MAMFGIGPTELLIGAVGVLLTVAVPIAIIVLLILVLRKQTLVSQLRDENQRLREELAAATGRKEA
jgi:Mn2+/Fe2+ NRAMP family transporter